MARTKKTPKDKARAKAEKAAKKQVRRERLSQLRQAFTVTRKDDKKLLPLMLVAFVVPLALFTLLGIWIGLLPIFILFGVLFGLVATVAVFGRRVQRRAYAQVEGQVGAAAQILGGMRGDWRVTPAVAFSREQDLVHRVIGRPGVVLVGEGAGNRTRNLLVAEKRKLARVVGQTPVYDVVVGDGEGQVPLRALEKHFAKLPRNIKPKTVNDLDRRLKALGGASLPIPKGPMPTNGRIPRGKVR